MISNLIKHLTQRGYVMPATIAGIAHILLVALLYHNRVHPGRLSGIAKSDIAVFALPLLAILASQYLITLSAIPENVSARYKLSAAVAILTSAISFVLSLIVAFNRYGT